MPPSSSLFFFWLFCFLGPAPAACLAFPDLLVAYLAVPIFEFEDGFFYKFLRIK